MACKGRDDNNIEQDSMAFKAGSRLGLREMQKYEFSTFFIKVQM
jgi:hypothetical protein